MTHSARLRRMDGTIGFCHQHEVTGEQLCLPPPSSPSSSREPPCPSHPEHDLWRASQSLDDTSKGTKKKAKQGKKERTGGGAEGCGGDSRCRGGCSGGRSGRSGSRSRTVQVGQRLVLPSRRLVHLLTGTAARPTRSQGALPTRRSSTTTTTPAPPQSASGATSARRPTAPPTTPPPTKTHAAPALLARRMTYSTPSTTISATVPTPAPAGSRQAAEPKSLLSHISCWLLKISLKLGVGCRDSFGEPVCVPVRASPRPCRASHTHTHTPCRASVL